MQLTETWVLVPARGGSKGIARKNLRLLHGRPLILHVLEELKFILPPEKIIVSTDDNEIAKLSEPYARIHRRSEALSVDQATLDEVATEVARWLISEGATMADILLTVQPTSPFLRYTTILEAVNKMKAGARSVITVKDDRHMRWTLDEERLPKPLFDKRVNRQWLPVTLAETGGIIGARIGDIIESGKRIQQPVSLLELDEIEGLDIDGYADWAAAEYYLRRKRIVIRADASSEIGMGHVYRAIALCFELGEHDLTIVTQGSGTYSLGAEFLQRHPYHVEVIDEVDGLMGLLREIQPHIIFLDILDTSQALVQTIKTHAQDAFIVSLEDLGTGAQLADLVINDLYTDFYPERNHWYGIQYSILAPQFEITPPKESINEKVTNILLTFGGTDPNNQTLKALQALQQIDFKGRVVTVLGFGYQHDTKNLEAFEIDVEIRHAVDDMAELMRQADLALTSAGRTVTELISIGTPTIVICQNLRELRHTHASGPYGVINLGLGASVEVSTLAHHIEVLLKNKHLREDMHLRARSAVQKRSNREIAQKILDAYSMKADEAGA